MLINNCATLRPALYFSLSFLFSATSKKGRESRGGELGERNEGRMKVARPPDQTKDGLSAQRSAKPSLLPPLSPETFSITMSILPSCFHPLPRRPLSSPPVSKKEPARPLTRHYSDSCSFKINQRAFLQSYSHHRYSRLYVTVRGPVGHLSDEEIKRSHRTQHAAAWTHRCVRANTQLMLIR